MNDHELLEKIRRELSHHYWQHEAIHKERRHDAERHHRSTLRLTVLLVVALALLDATIRA